MAKNNSDSMVIDNFCTDFEEHKFIFDNLDDVVWSMSWPDLKVQFISKAVEDSIGYSVEEFENDPLLLQKITHPDDKTINEKALKDLQNKGFSERIFRIINNNGNVKWMHDKAKMIYDEDNNPVRVEGIIKDITETIMVVNIFTKANPPLIIFFINKPIIQLLSSSPFIKKNYLIKHFI